LCVCGYTIFQSYRAIVALFDSRASTVEDDSTHNIADLSARRFQTAGLSVSGSGYSFLIHSAYVPACFRHDHRGLAGLGSDGVRRHSRDPRCPAAGRGGWPFTVDIGTGLDSADTTTGRSDPGGQWSDWAAKGHRQAEGHQMLQARRGRPWRYRVPTSSDRGWSGHLTPGHMTGTTPSWR
jgi:hypothetical protein